MTLHNELYAFELTDVVDRLTAAHVELSKLEAGGAGLHVLSCALELIKEDNTVKEAYEILQFLGRAYELRDVSGEVIDRVYSFDQIPDMIARHMHPREFYYVSISTDDVEYSGHGLFRVYLDEDEDEIVICCRHAYMSDISYEFSNKATEQWRNKK